MPYVITTNSPHGSGIAGHTIETARRTAATLEEARIVVAEQLGDHALMLADQPLSTIGGTIGPLPDGTVVEVEFDNKAAI